MITQEQINKCVAEKTPSVFYQSWDWRLKRREVLALDRWECQMCKQRGQYTRAVVVHHIRRLSDRPDLAMQIYNGDKRQLVSLCRACHEECHPERLRVHRYAKKKEHPIDERW